MDIQFTFKSLPRKEDLQFIIYQFSSLSYDSSTASSLYNTIQCLRSSSCLRLLSRLFVTSTILSIFPLITSYSPVSFSSFFFFTLCSILFSFSTHCNTISHTIGPTDPLHPSPAPEFKPLQLFPIYCPKCPSFSTIQNHTPNATLYFQFKITSNKFTKI
jgi:hypothetical protein